MPKTMKGSVMKKLLTIALIGLFAFAAIAAEANRAPKASSTVLNKNYAPTGNEINADVSLSTFDHSLREIQGVLVDSSKNGYGMLVSETNPISVNPADPNVIVLAYRQFVGIDATSGGIGGAISEDGGETWTTYSNLNDGLSVAGGRYPSALATESFPMIMWNESGGGGGGDYGGRAFYTFDEGEYFGEIWYDATDIHNNPQANDSWIVVPAHSVDADGNEYFNFAVADWSNNRDHITFHASTDGGWDGTELELTNAFTILNTEREFRWNGTDNYVSNGNMDINDDGIGYYAVTGYWADENLISNHTVFIKKTSDFGATWSPWYWEPDDLLDDYFSSIFPDSSFDMFDSTVTYLGDSLGAEWSPFLGYDLEVIADADGNVHIWSGVLPSWGESVYIRYSEEVGVYHFGAPADAFAGGGGPVAMDISPVGSMQLGWAYSLPGWSSNTISGAYDLNNDDHLFVTYYTVTDTGTSEEGGEWIDANIMGSWSADNGATWSTPENLTMTNDGMEADEIDVHVNRFAIDGEISMVYQIPDFDVPTIDPPDVHEDYLQRVYFLSHQFNVINGVEDDLAVNPESFSLNQNYPNPFNPSTLISFELPQASQVALTVFDIRGRELVSLLNGPLNAGRHEVQFNGSSYPSGSYFYRLEVDGQQDVKKMLLVK
jgi:hypothetical protein